MADDLSKISDEALLASINTDLSPPQESNTATIGKAVGRAAVNTAGQIADFGPNLANLGVAGYGALRGGGMFPGAQTANYVPPDLPFQPDVLSNYLKELVGRVSDLRNTRTDPFGKALSTGTEIASGALMSGGGLSGTARDIGLNVAAPALGAVGGEALAGETGKLAGAVGLPFLASAGSRAAFGPGAAEKVREMGAAGIPATAADVSERLAGMQGWLARLPFGGRLFAELAREKQTAVSEAQIGKLISSVGEDMKNTVLREKAGQTMAGGLNDWKARAYTAYGKLQELTQQVFPGTTQAFPRAYSKRLEELTAVSPTAPATSQPNADLLSRLKAVDTDMRGGNPNGAYQMKMTVDDLKHIREDLRPLAFPEPGVTLNVGTKARDYRGLYDAINQDIKNSAPSEAARNALDAENNFYTEFARRRENFIDDIYGRMKLRPEETLNRLTAGARKGAADVREAMRSLTAEERDVVAASQLKMLGMNRAGQFSTDTFLSNYGALAPAARQALLGGTTHRSMMSDLDTLSTAFGNIRQSVAAGGNPSGTAKEVVGIGTLVGLVRGFSKTVGVLGTGAVTQALLTNPTFVRWAAETAATPKVDVAVQLMRLNNMTRGESDPEAKAAIDGFISSARQEPVPGLTGTRG